MFRIPTFCLLRQCRSTQVLTGTSIPWYLICDTQSEVENELVVCYFKNRYTVRRISQQIGLSKKLRVKTEKSKDMKINAEPVMTEAVYAVNCSFDIKVNIRFPTPFEIRHEFLKQRNRKLKEQER